MKLGRVVIAGVVFAIISQIINTLGAYITMGYYFIEEYFPVWSRLMMPAAGSPPMDFYYYSIGFAIITGILIASVYSVIKRGIPGKSPIKQGLKYGFLLSLISTIPGMLGMALLINLPLELITYWALFGLLINLIGGTAIGKIVK